MSNTVPMQLKPANTKKSIGLNATKDVPEMSFSFFKIESIEDLALPGGEPMLARDSRDS